MGQLEIYKFINEYTLYYSPCSFINVLRISLHPNIKTSIGKLTEYLDVCLQES